MKACGCGSEVVQQRRSWAKWLARVLERHGCCQCPHGTPGGCSSRCPATQPRRTIGNQRQITRHTAHVRYCTPALAEQTRWRQSTRLCLQVMRHRCILKAWTVEPPTEPSTTRKSTQDQRICDFNGSASIRTEAASAGASANRGTYGQVLVVWDGVCQFCPTACCDKR
jgi:hypothetical protein